MYKIYRLICKPTGKSYIGQTTRTIEKRARKGYGYRDSPELYKAIREHGWDAFSSEILHETKDPTEANLQEIAYIKAYSTRHPNGYNIARGGPAFLKGKNNVFYGKKHTAETKEKIRAGREKAQQKRLENDLIEQYPFSPEAKQRLRDALKRHKDGKKL